MTDTIFTGTDLEFEAIVEKHKSAVYGTIYAYIQWNLEADDIAQEVFIYAYYNFGKLNDISKIGAWLCGIARNMALKKLRSTKFNIPLEHFQMQVKTDVSNPESDFIRRESGKELRDAVNSLSKPVAETIFLFYFSQKSIREISDLLSVSEGTIKSRLHDGRKKLKRKKEIIGMMKESGIENQTRSADLGKQVAEIIEKVKKLYGQNQNKTVREYCDEAIRMIENPGGYHRMLIELYRMRAFTGDRESNIADIEKQLSIAKMTGDKKLIAESLLAAAFDYDGDKGIQYHTEAYELALSVKYYAVCAESAFWAGMNYISVRNFKEAEKWMNLALKHYDENTAETSVNICEGDFLRIRAMAKAALESIESLRKQGRLEKGYVSINAFGYVLHLSEDEIRCGNGYGWDIPSTQWKKYRNTKNFSLSNILPVQTLLMPTKYIQGTVVDSDEYGYSGWLYTKRFEIVSDSETIETPSGTFENCIHIVITEIIPDYNPENEEHRDFYENIESVNFWYAKDIGCVKGIYKYPNHPTLKGGSFVLMDYKAVPDPVHPYFPLIEGNSWEYKRLGCDPDVRIRDKYTVDLVLPNSAYIGKTGWRYIEE